jgi:hypothetical protein
MEVSCPMEKGIVHEGRILVLAGQKRGSFIPSTDRCPGSALDCIGDLLIESGN